MAKDKSKAKLAAELEAAEPDEKPRKLKSRVYLEELAKLQIELSRLQGWVKARGLKVVVIVEGRDAAGKGGSIKTITMGLNPRIARVVALPPRPSASGPSGTSSATRSISRPPARSSCSIAAGTTAPASSE